MKKTALILGGVAVAAVATGVGVAARHHTSSELPTNKRDRMHNPATDDAKPATPEELAKAHDILGDTKPSGHSEAGKQD